MTTYACAAADPDFHPAPLYWVSNDDVELPPRLTAALAFKDVTAPTNVRTMIAAISIRWCLIALHLRRCRDNI